MGRDQPNIGVRCARAHDEQTATAADITPSSSCTRTYREKPLAAICRRRWARRGSGTVEKAVTVHACPHARTPRKKTLRRLPAGWWEVGWLRSRVAERERFGSITSRRRTPNAPAGHFPPVRTRILGRRPTSVTVASPRPTVRMGGVGGAGRVS